MAGSRPLFVFVPGGFQGPPHFGPIVEALGARGYDAVGITMPGTGADAGTAPPLESVKGVRAKIHELVEDEKREVVLVGCSYGGFVASMSVKGFEKSAGREVSVTAPLESVTGSKFGDWCVEVTRIDGYQKGGVKHIAFISALVIPEGQIMVNSLGGGSLPPWAEMDEQGGFLRPSQICSSIFYSDLDEASQKYWASFFEPVTFKDSVATVVDSCWDIDVPKTYVYTTKDYTNPLEQQEAIVAEVVKPRPGDWTFERMESDHSPFLSRVTEVADMLVKLAG